jgi:hypothetical protein
LFAAVEQTTYQYLSHNYNLSAINFTGIIKTNIIKYLNNQQQ